MTRGRAPGARADAPAWVRAPGAPLARSLLLPALLLAASIRVAAMLRAAPAASPEEIRAALRAGDEAVAIPEVSSASPDLARQQAVLRGVALELRSLDASPPAQRSLRRARAMNRLEDMSDAR